jgi:hypothetical protein
MTTRRLYGYYPSLVGLLLGVFQTSLFFQLSLTLSSSFGTYLMVTSCWLLGSVIGSAYLAKLRYHLNLFLALAVVSYLLCAGLLLVLPFQTSFWPLYAALIVLIGFYPGVFFARTYRIYRVSELFFRENNGFILGVLFGTLLFMLLGINRTVSRFSNWLTVWYRLAWHNAEGQATWNGGRTSPPLFIYNADRFKIDCPEN